MAYQPIENYGVIGDLNTVALVGLNGSIDFMCFPDFDSPTVFAAILDDKKGGSFAIQPSCNGMKHRQLYLPDTNVLLTRFLSDDGIKVVVDMKRFLYLAGTELNFSDGLNGKGFYFNNPNATRTCGCCDSFSV